MRWVGIRDVMKAAMYGMAELHGACWGDGDHGLVDIGEGVAHNGSWASCALGHDAAWGEFEEREVLNGCIREDGPVPFTYHVKHVLMKEVFELVLSGTVCTAAVDGCAVASGPWGHGGEHGDAT